MLAIGECLLSRYVELPQWPDLWQSLFTHSSWLGSSVLAIVRDAYGVVAAWA